MSLIADSNEEINSGALVAVVKEPPPAAAPEVAAMDTMTSAVNDAIKDHPTVSASVTDGVITLTGTIKKDKLPKLMMTLSSLKPKKIENKLTVN